MKHSAATVVGMLMAFATCTARADTVTDWNQTAIQVIRAAGVSGAPGTRSLAMMHVAMSDAINSVQGRYTRYIATVAAVPGASAEVAAAAAARQILVQLYPKQKTMVDEAYAESVKGIPDGDAKSAGVALGEQVAAAVQADRAADGANVPDTYRPLTSPGVWVPTTPPATEQYARVKPWVLKSADQFRPGPPPQLSSERYTRDYNETKNMGGTGALRERPSRQRRLSSGALPISPPGGKRRRANSRRRMDCPSSRTRASSRCSTWAPQTPSSLIGMRNSPIISGGRSPRSETATSTATTLPSVIPVGAH